MKSEQTRHYYRQYLVYEAFSDIETLNATTSYMVRECRDDMTKSQLEIFKKLANYSACIYGVSFQKVKNWVNVMDVNERTIRRAFKRFEELGIIKRYKQCKGPDVLVIQPKETLEWSDEMFASQAAQKAHNDADQRGKLLRKLLIL